MDIVYSDQVHLIKIFEVPKSPELILSDPSQEIIEYKDETIGVFKNFELAKKTLLEYRETHPHVFAYEIIGPQWRYRESEIRALDENIEAENEISDDSPEYQLLYDSNKKLISSYFFDEKKQGGERLSGEKIFSKGEKAFVRISIYVGENHHDLLIPVIIEGKPTIGYLYNKWKKILWEIDKRVKGDKAEEPSDVRILHEIEGLNNIEKDSLVFKPLVSVKCNWGEEPTTPFDDAPRIDFLTFQSVLSHETKFS